MKTAVWAINPFDLETRPSAAALAELSQWAQATGTEVQPVHVLYVPSAEPASEERGEWVSRYVPAVEAEMASYLKGVQLPKLKLPKVLAQHHGTTREAIGILDRYARDVHASWVIVSSKGQSGILRMALGSFAESFIASSSSPVWVFGTQGSLELDSKKILFATDFSEESKIAFENVVDQAAQLGASIRIFHSVSIPSGLVVGNGVMGIPGCTDQQYLEAEIESGQNQGTYLAMAARKRGVTVDVVVKQTGPGRANAILFEARACRAGIIALASRRGPVAAAVLGSNARQLVRQAECPVWVFGPNYKEMKIQPARRTLAVGG